MTEPQPAIVRILPPAFQLQSGNRVTPDTTEETLAALACTPETPLLDPPAEPPAQG